MESWIEQFGYLAVFVGTFLEGETILALAGFAAHGGYLHLPQVIVAAFLGSLSGDQLFFYLGMRHSDFILNRRPGWRRRLDRAAGLIRHHQILIILGFRFLYGLRTVTPFALGMSRVPLRLFIPLNIVSACVWSVAVGCAGYLFGQALEVFLGDLRRYEALIFVIVIGTALPVWGIRLFRMSRKKR